MPAEASALVRRHRQAREAARPHRWRSPSWWAPLRRVAWCLFLVVTGVWLVQLGRRLDWEGALAGLQALPSAALWAAAGGVVVAHGAYSAYELLGRAVAPPGSRDASRWPARRWLLAVGFVTFAVKLSLGALIGGVALRYRLYGRLGLPLSDTTRLLAVGVVSNWLGYSVLMGGLLLLAPPPLPTAWGLPVGTGSGVLGALGVLLLAGAGAYLALCTRPPGRQRTLHWRDHAISLPPPRAALAQVGLSVLHWAATAHVCWALLDGQVAYAHVLGALLLSGVVGVLTHVPGGLGVMEAVFLAVLGGEATQAALLAAMLAFRALYFLLPLALALPLYFGLDRHGPRARASARAAPGAAAASQEGPPWD